MSTTTTPQKPAMQMPPLSPEHQATQAVATKLAQYCATGKNLDAIRELYADDARHVEVAEAPWCPRISSGKKTLLEKAEQFHKSTTIHSASCGTPIVNGDQFVVTMGLDCTSNMGPMAGQRMNISETALYTVKNGRITEGKFFYPMTGCGE
ncbi:MAG TPA: nuclear transport factor 2 family protein [Phycisphaerales bacterium]|nr:nuclear transport factor 2 family protein [Phycisphaerales bacterium]